MSSIRNANRALIQRFTEGNQPMANSQAPLPPEIIATKVPADNRYGQNGYQGPSSIEPGKPQPTSAFKGTTDDAVRDLLAQKGFSDQTRKIDTEQHLPTTHGMKSPNASPVKIQSKLGS
jgi:hypothetical protein